MAFTYNWETHGICFEFFGVVTAEDIFHANMVFYNDPRCDASKYQIFDFSKVEQRILTEEDIERFAALDSGSSFSIPSMKKAFILNNSLEQALCKYYIDVVQRITNNWEFKIFDDLHRARQWVLIKNRE